MSKKDDKGFGVVEVLVAIIVIGLLVTIGWVLLQRRGNETANNNQQTASQGAVDTPSTTKKPTYSFENAVAGINEALSETACGGAGAEISESDVSQVSDSEQFSYQQGKSAINKNFTYAFMQYGCESQGSISLLKRANADDKWVLVSEDARIYPMCDKVRGQGFPVSIIDKCYANNRATEPVKI